MQISRHWRNQQQRYRLEGSRFQDGEVSLQPRPLRSAEGEPRRTTTETSNGRSQELGHVAIALSTLAT